MFILRIVTPIVILSSTVTATPRADLIDDMRAQQKLGRKNITNSLSTVIRDTSEDKSNRGLGTTTKRVQDKISLLKEIPDQFSQGQVGRAFTNFGEAVSGLGEVIESDTSVAGFVSHHILDNVEKAFRKIELPGYGKLIKVGILAFSETFNDRFENLISIGFQFLATQLDYEDYQHLSKTLIRFQKDYEFLSPCVFVRVKKVMLDNLIMKRDGPNTILQ